MVEVTVDYNVPGGPFAVESRSEWVRATMLNALVFGPGVFVVNLLANVRPEATRRLERWLGRAMVRGLRIDLQIEGREFIDPSEQYVVTPLHEGFADVLVLLQLGLPLRFVALEEIATDWPIFRRHVAATDHILVPGGKPRTAFRRLLKALPTVADSQDNLVIFPQGTILGIETAFLPGFLRVAQILERPVLPVVISGSHRIWEHPFSQRLRFGQRVSVKVLPPVDAGSVDVALLQKTMKVAALDSAAAPARRYRPAIDGLWPGYAFSIDPDFAEDLAL